MKKMPKENETFVRINSRVRPSQLAYIKEIAARKGVTEGEMHRIIIDYFINKH